MGAPSDQPIWVHAQPTARMVAMGGADAEAVRARATAAIGALLDDPPAVILTSACSTALDAAAALLDLRPGDEVVVPAFTFPTSISPFVARGAAVRFADVDPATANVTSATVAERIGHRTRAVVVMHYGGVGVDDGLLDGTFPDGIDLIEDAAQGLFAQALDRPLGRFGRFAAISFHRTKNLSSLEGGALVVNAPDDVEGALIAVDKGTDRAAFDAGLVPSYDWQGLGSAWRLAEPQLRYLAEELGSIERIQARRHEVWATYQEQLAGWAAERGVSLPCVPDGRAHPAHLYYLLLPDQADRPGFVDHCRNAGVQAVRHYGSMPESPFGQTLRHPSDRCPVAGDLAARLVRIPLHQDLTEADVGRVVAAVRAWR